MFKKFPCWEQNWEEHEEAQDQYGLEFRTSNFDKL